MLKGALTLSQSIGFQPANDLLQSTPLNFNRLDDILLIPIANDLRPSQVERGLIMTIVETEQLDQKPLQRMKPVSIFSDDTQDKQVKKVDAAVVMAGAGSGKNVPPKLSPKAKDKIGRSERISKVQEESKLDYQPHDLLSIYLKNTFSTKNPGNSMKLKIPTRGDLSKSEIGSIYKSEISARIKSNRNHARKLSMSVLEDQNTKGSTNLKSSIVHPDIQNSQANLIKVAAKDPKKSMHMRNQASSVIYLRKMRLNMIPS
ncbi:hypothetical protein FGO68_gene10455 [Halteria grandinella]|uniref:Uncharacterized protein n=1 Tax=Halteria grandinella TaxID=5974 RepID=A0A8J8NHU0_HALGN|nr:hypothetical protein FGO68_gene10455 [Halteria grandinella]